MNSLVWEDFNFASKHKENFRRRQILNSSIWATFNLIVALWLTAFWNPSHIFLRFPHVTLKFLFFQIIVSLLLCLILLSTARHLYIMYITLNGFDSVKQEAKTKSVNSSVCENDLGPSIFPKALSKMPSFAFMSGETDKVPMGISPSSWCPDRFSPSMRPFNETSPLSVSISSAQPMPTASDKIISPTSINISTRSDQGWSSPLTPASRRTSLTRWGTYSSNSPSNMVLPLQYQLSPSLGSPVGSVGCLDVGSNFGKNIHNSGSSSRRSEDTGNRLYSDAADDDDAFGNLVRRDQRVVAAPEKSASEYWKANNVTEFDLGRWTVDIRRWLHGTVLRRVVDEIASVNAKISKLSDDAALIGSTTLNTLEQLAKGRYQHISALPTLIRFLELTKDQGYFVFRLKELARGSCLGEFRWDGGSRSTVHPWKDYLPNDTMVILHIFSTYMDCLLPPHAKCLTDGVFSQLHLVRSPDKPDLKSRYNAQIYVVATQPPLIKIVIDGIIYTFPPDRHNLYHALLMFFHFYKSLDGTIRSISLGHSGLNVAWIFEKR